VADRLPLEYVIPIYPGQTKPLPVRWRADGALVDLTGYSATLGLWTPAGVLVDTAADGGESAEFGITLELGGADGTITATFPAEFAADSAEFGELLYDLILTDPDGRTYALLRGRFDFDSGRPAA
jgi:hypothetical protein